jgi:DNA polymerase epsilon subunit 1
LCEGCGSIRDLDLCKDDSLVHEQKVSNSSVFTWLCDSCGKEYNRVALEELLIQQLQKNITMYQVQDMKCSKCKRIKEDNLSDHCDCSGTWTETVSRESVSKMLQSYRRVAEYYNYRLVEDLISAIRI